MAKVLLQYSFCFYQDPCWPVDKEEIALLKLVGSRMREARGLCELQVHQAAKLLGVNPEYLIQIERCIDIVAVPFVVIKKAAQVYDVSIDFLFGLNEDWENALEVRASRDISTFLLEHRIEMFSKVAVKQLRHKKQLDELSAAVDSLRLEVASIFEGLDRFKELNPEFDDMPGGAQLQFRIKKANQKAIEAHLRLIKVKALPKPEKLPEAQNGG